MKVLHLPFSYFPDPAAGTEIYVATLARELLAHDIESVVAAPSRDGTTRRYEYDGLPVHRYALERDVPLAELYGEGSAAGAAAVGALLRSEGADVLHMHALGYGTSLRTVRAAHEAGVPVVFTHHATTVSCQRGSLVRNGTVICDGVLDVRRCTACTLRHHGVAPALSDAMALVPPGLASLVTRAGAHGGMWTGVQMPELMRLRHDAFRALMRELDVVVAVSEWVRELLLRNGVNGEKIVLSRQGVAVGGAGAARDPRPHRDGLRAALLGRLDPTKGVHVVLEALRRAPDLPLSVDIFGIAQDATHERYGERVRALAGGDARVRFLPAIPREQVVERLADYDVVLVPSQYLETGPLVVLEAFAAGTPVIGSRLGGIIERVRHEIDGLLVDAMSAPAWTLALQRLVAEPDLLPRLRAGVTSPRTMTEVAAEMAALYERVAAPASVAATPRG